MKMKSQLNKKQNEIKEKQKFEHYFNDIFSNSNDTGDDNDNDDDGCNYCSKNKSTECDQYQWKEDETIPFKKNQSGQKDIPKEVKKKNKAEIIDYIKRQTIK